MDISIIIASISLASSVLTCVFSCYKITTIEKEKSGIKCIFNEYSPPSLLAAPPDQASPAAPHKTMTIKYNSSSSKKNDIQTSNMHNGIGDNNSGILQGAASGIVGGNMGAINSVMKIGTKPNTPASSGAYSLTDLSGEPRASSSFIDNRQQVVDNNVSKIINIATEYFRNNGNLSPNMTSISITSNNDSQAGSNNSSPMLISNPCPSPSNAMQPLVRIVPPALSLGDPISNTTLMQPEGNTIPQGSISNQLTSRYPTFINQASGTGISDLLSKGKVPLSNDGSAASTLIKGRGGIGIFSKLLSDEEHVVDMSGIDPLNKGGSFQSRENLVNQDSAREREILSSIRDHMTEVVGNPMSDSSDMV